LEADEWAEWEDVGDVIAEGVATVSAGTVGFIEFSGGAAGSVEGPGDLLEIADEFAAAWIDVEMVLVQSVAETAIDAVDAVAHGRIRGSGVDGGPVEGVKASEELADECPIGSGAGGAALIAAGIAIDLHCKGASAGERLGALIEGLAGSLGIGVGLDYDFIKNINAVTATLHEQHAHGINVEIERPNDRQVG